MGLAFSSAIPTKASSLQKLTPEFSFGLEVFAKRFFRTIFQQIPHPFIIVFDNLQEVPEDHPLIEILSNVCLETPKASHLVFISRQTPPPAFSRLVTNRLLVSLNWNAIRFTREEAVELSRLLGYRDHLDGEFSQLYQQTDGWAAGLILLLQKKSWDPADAAAHETVNSTIFDYFAWEVFKKLTPGDPRYPPTGGPVTEDNAKRYRCCHRARGFLHPARRLT